MWSLMKVYDSEQFALRSQEHIRCAPSGIKVQISGSYSSANTSEYQENHK